MWSLILLVVVSFCINLWYKRYRSHLLDHYIFNKWLSAEPPYHSQVHGLINHLKVVGMKAPELYWWERFIIAKWIDSLEKP